MEEEEFRVVAGIDPGSRKHKVWVVDPEGKKLREWSVEHKVKQVTEMAERLVQLAEGDPSKVAVTLDTKHGILVDTLIERGMAVFHINPKQLDRLRDRYFPSGAKDDAKDAQVQAEEFVKDRRVFHRIILPGPLCIQLTELSRLQDMLKKELTRNHNRLWNALCRYFPALLELSADGPDPFIWDLLGKADTPKKAQKLKRATVEKILRDHRIRRLNADQVLEVLRGPAPQLAPGSAQSLSMRVASLLPILHELKKQLDQCDRDTEKLLDEIKETEKSEQNGEDSAKKEHHDIDIILSSPGAGSGTVATVFSLVPQAIAERDYNTLRTYGGSAPVTKKSGKTNDKPTRANHVRRYHCNKRLERAYFWWGMNAIKDDERCRAHYDALRARGHTHGRALRGMMDRLLKVVVAMLRDGTLYQADLRKPLNLKEAA